MPSLNEAKLSAIFPRIASTGCNCPFASLTEIPSALKADVCVLVSPCAVTMFFDSRDSDAPSSSTLTSLNCAAFDSAASVSTGTPNFCEALESLSAASIAPVMLSTTPLNACSKTLARLMPVAIVSAFLPKSLRLPSADFRLSSNFAVSAPSTTRSAPIVASPAMVQLP